MISGYYFKNEANFKNLLTVGFRLPTIIRIKNPDFVFVKMATFFGRTLCGQIAENCDQKSDPRSIEIDLS
jgi:hypothetical protein